MELAFKKQGFIIYKLIPCFIITTFAFMCLYGSYVYATDNDNIEVVFTDTYNNTDYTVTLPNWVKNYHYFFYSINSGSNSFKYALIVSTSDIYFNQTSNGTYDYVSSSTGVSVLSASSTGMLNGTFYPQSTINNWSEPTTFSSGQQVAFYIYGYEDVATFSCNYDVLDYNNTDNVVFQAPLQVQPIVASQVGEVEMNRTLSEIMEILPIVIVVIVGLIAIRKGIIFLITLMKRQ